MTITPEQNQARWRKWLEQQRAREGEDMIVAGPLMPLFDDDRKVRLNLMVERPMVSEVRRLSKLVGVTEARIWRAAIDNGLQVLDREINKALLTDEYLGDAQYSE